MNPQTALSNLITAARNARLTADEHEAIKESIGVLIKFINENISNTGNSESKKG
jgi:hypothetical protein